MTRATFSETLSELSLAFYLSCKSFLHPSKVISSQVPQQAYNLSIHIAIRGPTYSFMPNAKKVCALL